MVTIYECTALVFRGDSLYALDPVYGQTKEQALEGMNKLASALGIKQSDIFGHHSCSYTPLDECHMTDEQRDEAPDDCSSEPLCSTSKPLDPQIAGPGKQEESTGDTKGNQIVVDEDCKVDIREVLNVGTLFYHRNSVSGEVEQIELLKASEHEDLINDVEESYFRPFESVFKPSSTSRPSDYSRKVDDQVGRHRIVRLFRHLLLPFFISLIGGLIVLSILS